jgi:hypothetical protein
LQIEHFESDHIGLRVDCEQSTELVVRVLQDGGWSARLLPVGDGGASPSVGAIPSVKPVSSHLGLFQTLSVPAGKWRVVMDYTAPGLRVGSILSALTLGASLFYFFCGQLAGAVACRWVGRRVFRGRGCEESLGKR